MNDDPSTPRPARGRPEPRRGTTSSGSSRASSRDDRRVDELRQRLRSLGYLDAGVDRFVLAPAVRTRHPALIALLASLRSGAIAGALLGPAAAVGISGRLPGLITGMRDAIVIAIYLAVLSGTAVTILSFVAALLVSAVARASPSGHPGRTLSTAAGMIVSLACLAYLTLWWRTANAGFGWDAPVWTAFALVVAVAISLLIGHVVTLTARAVVVARTTRQTQQPRVPGVSWKFAAVAGVLAFVGAASLLVLMADVTSGDAPIPITVRSTGARVTVLAIDGFDPTLYAGVTKDDAPSLHEILNPVRAELAPADSRDPARLWTTIATGRRPEVHGVERLETRRVAGLRGRLTSERIGELLEAVTGLLRLTSPAIASNVERRVRTFWEVAAQAGLRTAVVNWWATWPAASNAGTVMSDRAILRLEHGGELDGEIAPPELYARLQGEWPVVRRNAKERVASYFAMTDSMAPELSAPLRAVLTRSAELDSSVLSLVDVVATDLDLLVVYLPGLDIAQHTLFGIEAPAPSQVNERLSALRRYYRYLDFLLSDRLLKIRLRPDSLLFMITQPGRLHRGKGIFAAAGREMRTAHASGTVMDVAPTVLHALGVPVARDLDGRVIDALFTRHFRDEHPVRFVETYGFKENVPRAQGGRPLDAEAIERLRSLGYIK